jgi:hypothetical protein
MDLSKMMLGGGVCTFLLVLLDQAAGLRLPTTKPAWTLDLLALFGCPRAACWIFYLAFGLTSYLLLRAAIAVASWAALSILHLLPASVVIKLLYPFRCLRHRAILLYLHLRFHCYTRPRCHLNSPKPLQWLLQPWLPLYIQLRRCEVIKQAHLHRLYLKTSALKHRLLTPRRQTSFYRRQPSPPTSKHRAVLYLATFLLFSATTASATLLSTRPSPPSEAAL